MRTLALRSDRGFLARMLSSECIAALGLSARPEAKDFLLSIRDRGSAEYRKRFCGAVLTAVRHDSVLRQHPKSEAYRIIFGPQPHPFAELEKWEKTPEGQQWDEWYRSSLGLKVRPPPDKAQVQSPPETKP